MRTSLMSPDDVWTQEAIRHKVEKLGTWFHNIDLKGVQTAPHHFLGDYPRLKWECFREAIPRDLTGMSVLDIGCNAGFYSFEMKKRGAARVLGMDWDEDYLKQARFAAQVLDLNVEFQKLSVWQIAELREKFDLVIFMGVFYHLRHPLLALDLIHEHVAKDLLLFQSLQRGPTTVTSMAEDYGFQDSSIFEDPGCPRMYFIEHSYSGDPTNWWFPNQACVEAMLRSAGFSIESHPEQEVYLCRWQQLPAAPDGPRVAYPSK